MSNSLSRIKIDEKGHVRVFKCDECGFTTPTFDGVWGKDLYEMEEEHLEYLHMRLENAEDVLGNE